MTALGLEAWATLATAVIGCVVLVLEHLKTRSPNEKVQAKLDDHESRITKLENWKNT